MNIKEELQKIQDKFEAENKKLLKQFEKDMAQIKMPSNLGPEFSQLPQKFIDLAREMAGSMDVLGEIDGKSIGDMVDSLKAKGALTPELEELIMKILEEVDKKCMIIL